MKKAVIGNSTLYCGDCFAILTNLLIKADVVISDPPLGITACDWDVALHDAWHRTGGGSLRNLRVIAVIPASAVSSTTRHSASSI